MKKVLFVATVVKAHIMPFHLPYLKWFHDNGYEVHVAAKNDYDNIDTQIPYCDFYHNVNFSRNPLSIKNLKAFIILKRIIRGNNFQIIHSHTPVGGLVTRLTRKRNSKAKYVYTAHGFHFYKGAPFKNWLFYYPVERFLSKLTDYLIVINKEDLKRAQRFKAKKIVYSKGIGFNARNENSNNSNGNIVRNELGIIKSNFIILSVGEINKNKNHILIIKAMHKNKDDNTHLVICGEGNHKEKLEKVCDKFGLSNNVHLVGFRENIHDFYKIADLFVFPSKREGLSVALMEAMYHELPIICSNIRGNIDLIINGYNGLVANCPQEYASLIEYCKNNLEVTKQYGIRAKKVVGEYGIEPVLQNIVKEVYLNET